MKKIHINASKPYDVVIGHGLINEIISLIEPLCLSKHIAIITDDIVNDLYSQCIIQQLKNNGFDVLEFVFSNGEQSKNIDTLK